MKNISEYEWEIKVKQWNEDWEKWIAKHKGKFWCKHETIHFIGESDKVDIDIKKEFPDLPTWQLNAIVNYPHSTIKKSVSMKYTSIRKCVKCGRAWVKGYNPYVQ